MVFKNGGASKCRHRSDGNIEAEGLGGQTGDAGRAQSGKASSAKMQTLIFALRAWQSTERFVGGNGYDQIVV